MGGGAIFTSQVTSVTTAEVGTYLEEKDLKRVDLVTDQLSQTAHGPAR